MLIAVQRQRTVTVDPRNVPICRVEPCREKKMKNDQQRTLLFFSSFHAPFVMSRFVFLFPLASSFRTSFISLVVVVVVVVISLVLKRFMLIDSTSRRSTVAFCGGKQHEGGTGT